MKKNNDPFAIVVYVYYKLKMVLKKVVCQHSTSWKQTKKNTSPYNEITCCFVSGKKVNIIIIIIITRDSRFFTYRSTHTPIWLTILLTVACMLFLNDLRSFSFECSNYSLHPCSCSLVISLNFGSKKKTCDLLFILIIDNLSKFFFLFLKNKKKNLICCHHYHQIFMWIFMFYSCKKPETKKKKRKNAS